MGIFPIFVQHLAIITLICTALFFDLGQVYL